MKCCRTGTRQPANQAAAGPVRRIRGRHSECRRSLRALGSRDDDGRRDWMGSRLGLGVADAAFGPTVWAAGTARDRRTGASGPLEELRRAELALETTVHRRLPEWSPEADADEAARGRHPGGHHRLRAYRHRARSPPTGTSSPTSSADPSGSVHPAHESGFHRRPAWHRNRDLGSSLRRSRETMPPSRPLSCRQGRDRRTPRSTWSTG